MVSDPFEWIISIFFIFLFFPSYNYCSIFQCVISFYIKFSWEKIKQLSMRKTSQHDLMPPTSRKQLTFKLSAEWRKCFRERILLCYVLKDFWEKKFFKSHILSYATIAAILCFIFNSHELWGSFFSLFLLILGIIMCTECSAWLVGCLRVIMMIFIRGMLRRS